MRRARWGRTTVDGGGRRCRRRGGPTAVPFYCCSPSECLHTCTGMMTIIIRKRACARNIMKYHKPRTTQTPVVYIGALQDVPRGDTSRAQPSGRRFTVGNTTGVLTDCPPPSLTTPDDRSTMIFIFFFGLSKNMSLSTYNF